MSKFKQLEVGQVYKSYRQLCEFLGEPIQNGNSKKAQIKEWECNFSYHKQGNKFIIDEVYSEPLLKEDGRGKDSVYSEAVQLLILDMLGYKNGKITISKSQLLKSIGITNENYGIGKVNVDKLSKYLGIGKEYLYDFYNTSSNNFTGIINSALNALEDKRIIFHNKVIKLKSSSDNSTRIATNDEIEIILQIEKEALDTVGYSDVKKVRNSKSFVKFETIKKDLLKSTDIEYYYNAYQIVVNNKYIDGEKDSLVGLMLSKITRDKNKKELNQIVVKNTVSNAEKRQANFYKSEKKAELRFSDDYVPNMELICNSVLDLNAVKIDFNSIDTTYQPQLSDSALSQIESLF